jgi:hypothetical protein
MSSTRSDKSDSTISPRGISPLPERPRRTVARVDYAALDNSNNIEAEPGPQQPRASNNNSSRKRSAAAAATAKSDSDVEYESGTSSEEGAELVDSDFEELSEDAEAGAAEGLMDLADAAQQATMQQDQQQRKRTGKKEEYADAR